MRAQRRRWPANASTMQSLRASTPEEIEKEVGNTEIVIFQTMQCDGYKEVSEELLAVRKTPPTVH
jgi:hypothetical protein